MNPVMGLVDSLTPYRDVVIGLFAFGIVVLVAFAIYGFGKQAAGVLAGRSWNDADEGVSAGGGVGSASGKGPEFSPGNYDGLVIDEFGESGYYEYLRDMEYEARRDDYI